MFYFRNTFVVIIVIALLTYAVVSVTQVYAQNGGLRIAPVIQWADDKDGHFNYCVYKGAVTFSTNIDNDRKYCLVATENPSLDNMYTNIGDNINIYYLDDVVIPPNVIRDGQEYSICVGFNPQSEADYSVVEKCQSFYNTEGSHVETPFINLDRDACYDCDYD